MISIVSSQKQNEEYMEESLMMSSNQPWSIRVNALLKRAGSIIIGLRSRREVFNKWLNERKSLRSPASNILLRVLRLEITQDEAG